MITPRPLCLLACLAASLVAACGGGGGPDGGQAQALGPQPVLSVTAEPIKTLAFNWSGVAGASSYALLQDPDGASGPAIEQVLATLPATARSHAWTDVFLPQQVGATFRLRACDPSTCVDSLPVGAANLDAGIGYFKSSNRQMAFDEFGRGLALSGDGRVMAVGAPYENVFASGVNPGDLSVTSPGVGAVYLFERSGAGWQQTAYVKPLVPLGGAAFGFSVALSANGHVLLVGASTHSGVASQSGALFVFRRQPDGQWAQEALLKAPVPQANAWLGYEVALSSDGEWAAAAQPYTPGGGEVVVFRRVSGVWTTVTTLKGSNTEAFDDFGTTVVVGDDGASIIVGAPLEDGALSGGADNSVSDAGAVYVFTRDAADAWSEVAYLKAAQPRAGALFGQSMAGSGDGSTLAVGGPLANPLIGAASEVQIFERTAPNTWAHAERLSPPQDLAQDEFGLYSIAMSADGTALAVSSHRESGDGTGLSGFVAGASTSQAGAVHVYRRNSAGGWSAPRYLKAPNNQPGLLFGFALAFTADGGALAVHGRDASAATGIGGDQTDRSALRAGAVYLY